jgi:RNA polymerase sigma factor (sigma-70 family)
MSVNDKEKLIVDNLGLVHFVMRNYVKIPPGLYEDLYQEGCLGLCKAAETYEPEKGSFSTHAVYCIKGSIYMYLRDNHAVHIPRSCLTKGDMPVVSSLEEELNEDGFQLLHTLEDEHALDDLNVNLLEDVIIQEAQCILSTYDKVHADICLEDLCSKMWDEPATQQYLAAKYKVSQPHISRILRRFYIDLEPKIKN